MRLSPSLGWKNENVGTAVPANARAEKTRRGKERAGVGATLPSPHSCSQLCSSGRNGAAIADGTEACAKDALQILVCRRRSGHLASRE